MDLTGLLLTAAALLYVLAAIVLANREDATGRRGLALRWMLYGVVVAIVYLGLNVGAIALFQSSGGAVPGSDDLPPISGTAALLALALAAGVAVLCGAIITTPAARLGVRRLLPPDAAYNPDSSVHTAALVLALALVPVMATQFVLGGGLAGFAAAIEATGISLGELAFNGAIFIVAAFLGVGLNIRRALPHALARLGLRRPTSSDWKAGVAVGLLLIVFQVVAGMFWVALVPPEQFAEQTAAAEQIGQAIGTLPLALAVSIFAAIGEETFFRGALQPVFGLVPTSLLFAVIHLQYTLTPATVLIVVVALVIGWVRARFSTTAAILAHFLYNFIPLSLSFLLSMGQPP